MAPPRKLFFDGAAFVLLFFLYHIKVRDVKSLLFFNGLVAASVKEFGAKALKYIVPGLGQNRNICLLGGLIV